ncbi:hypothetical protein RP20_CCG017936 [Aedes albopictus]|nr:hypothetical protein RP20_CCG017936 [Aedes albopictus]
MVRIFGVVAWFSFPTSVLTESPPQRCQTTKLVGHRRLIRLDLNFQCPQIGVLLSRIVQTITRIVLR